MTLQDFLQLYPWSALCTQIFSAQSKSSTSQWLNKWFQPKQKEVEFANTYLGRFTDRYSKTLFEQVLLESFTISFSTQDRQVLGERNVVCLQQSLDWLKSYLKIKSSYYLRIIVFLHCHSGQISKPWKFYQLPPFAQIALVDAH